MWQSLHGDRQGALQWQSLSKRMQNVGESRFGHERWFLRHFLLDRAKGFSVGSKELKEKHPS